MLHRQVAFFLIARKDSEGESDSGSDSCSGQRITVHRDGRSIWTWGLIFFFIKAAEGCNGGVLHQAGGSRSSEKDFHAIGGFG